MCLSVRVYVSNIPKSKIFENIITYTPIHLNTLFITFAKIKLHKILYMKYFAEIDIMPKKELLDPQGKTVSNNMKNLDISGVDDVRIGKHITMTFDASSEEDANTKVETACKKLLANMIMENYTFSLKQL